MIELLQEEKKKGVERSWLWLNLLLIVLVFLLVGLGIGFYYTKTQLMLQKVDQLQQKTDKIQKIHDLEEEKISELQKTISDQGVQLQQQDQSIKHLSLFEQQRQWRLDEIRYLVNLANTSLLFSRDIKMSYQLLSQVHTNILELHDATLIILDQAVQSDMRMLAETILEDTSQVFLQISSVNQKIDKMPLLGSRFVREGKDPVALPVMNTWQERLKQTWHQLQFFLVIKKTPNSLLPLIAQEQGEYIYQYIHLQLGQAQWAAINNNNAVYQASLQQANFWVGHYFLAQDSKTQTVLRELDVLQKMDISFSNVTLIKTNNALRVLTDK